MTAAAGIRINRTLAAITLLLWALSSPTAWAEGHIVSSEKLRTYILRNFTMGDKYFDDIKFRAVSIDLNGDGVKEIVAFVTSNGLCGSGGCRTLVLEPVGGDYRMVMNAVVTHSPIRALNTRHHGWRDIGVLVGGGGILHAYEAAMVFDGRSYPSSPPDSPARRLNHPAGAILIGRYP